MKKYLVIIAFFFSALTFAQDKVTESFSISYEHETKREYQKSIDAMLTVYTKDSYSINLRLGWLYYLNSDLYKSKAHYQNAIELQPKSIEARFGLAYPVYAMKNTDEVIQIYNDILKIDAVNTTARHRLASIYFSRKEWAKAESQLAKVIELYPFDFDSNLLLGQIYIKNGKINEAKKILNLALQYNPSSSIVLELLGNL